MKMQLSDFEITFVCPKNSFGILDTGRIAVQDESHSFEDLNCCIYQNRNYICLETGLSYAVEAIAFEQETMIHKFLYINNELVNAGYRIKHYSDNALFNMCSSSEKAVAYMLNHAESLVLQLAFNDHLVK